MMKKVSFYFPDDGWLSGRLHGWEGTVDWLKIGSVNLKYPLVGCLLPI